MDNAHDYGLVVHGKQRPSRISIMFDNVKNMIKGMLFITLGLGIVAFLAVMAWLVLNLVFGRAISGADDKALTMRWIYTILLVLAYPTTLMISLPALPRFATSFFGLMNCRIRLLFDEDEKQLKEKVAPKLDPGEQILAHMYSDEHYQERAWVPTLYYGALATLCAIGLAVSSLLWLSVEPFNYLYFTVFTALSFVLLVWATDLFVGYDVVSGALLNLITVVVLIFTLDGFGQLPILKYVLPVFVVIQCLVLLKKIGRIFSGRYIILTNKGIRKVKGKMQYFPMPKVVVGDPERLLPVNEIRFAPVSQGERWTIPTAMGQLEYLYPMFVSAKSLAACAKDCGLSVFVRADESEPRLGFSLSAFAFFGMWALLFLFIVAPTYHYGSVLMSPAMVELQKDETKKLELADIFLRVAKHHPTAMYPRANAATLLIQEKKYDEATKVFTRLNKLLELLPSKFRNTDKNAIRAAYAYNEMLLRKSLAGKNPTGWEPKNKKALVSYRKAAFYLFTTESKYWKHRPKEAFRLLDKAIRIAPKSAAPRLLKAYACWEYSFSYKSEKKAPSLKYVVKQANKRLKVRKSVLAPLLKNKSWKEAAETVLSTPLVLSDKLLFFILLDEYIAGGIKSKERVLELARKREQSKLLSSVAFMSMAASPPTSPAEVLERLNVPPVPYKRPQWNAIKTIKDEQWPAWFRDTLKRTYIKLPDRLIKLAKEDEKYAWLLK